jgi:hypothetical protein
MPKKILLFAILVLVFSAPAIVKAQDSPVLYFCEKYDQDRGEINISDRFTKGYITVMVKSDYELGLKKVHIQFDKWDPYSHSFKFYKKFNFTIQPDMKYVYFSKNDDSDMSFDETGFYRVYLLNDSDNTVACSLVQIVN